MTQENTKRFSGLFIILAVFFLSGGMPAQESQDVSSIDRVGTTAAQFLKIGVGARPIALGGAYTALANDILSVYWNPAGLSRIVGFGEAAFTHAEWLAETNFDFAAFSMNVGVVGTFGVQVISLRTPEQPVRTYQNPEGTGQNWDASSISVGLTFAKNLTDQFSIGFTGKFVQETIFNLSARGAAFDLGILYNTPFKSLTLGATITNFGSKMRLDGRDVFFNEDPFSEEGSVDQVPSKYRTEEFEMPLSMRFGVAWEAFTSQDVTVLAVADGVQPNDNAEYLNSGLEVGLKNVIFLRGGYKTIFLEETEQGATFGVGLRYDTVGANFKFDFGWADYGRLDNVQFVSFSVKY